MRETTTRCNAKKGNLAHQMLVNPSHPSSSTGFPQPGRQFGRCAGLAETYQMLGEVVEASKPSFAIGCVLPLEDVYRDPLAG